MRGQWRRRAAHWTGAGCDDLKEIKPSHRRRSDRDLSEDQAAVASDVVGRAAEGVGVEDALASEVDDDALLAGGARVLEEDCLEGDRGTAAPLDVLAMQAVRVLVSQRHALEARRRVVLDLPRHAQVLGL